MTESPSILVVVSALLLTAMVAPATAGTTESALTAGAVGAGTTTQAGSPTLQVRDTSVSGSVTEGETLDVDVTVENTGDVETTANVTLKADPNPVSNLRTVDSKTVTVAPGETETHTVSYETEDGDAPAVDIRAVTEQSAGDIRTVRVEQGSEFEVSIEDLPSEVVAGENITVDYQIRNAGTRADTQTIDFRVDGSTESTESGISLGTGNATETLNFTYGTDEADTPWVEIAVESDDDAVSLPVTVAETDTDDGAGQTAPGAETDGDGTELSYDSVSIERAELSAVGEDPVRNRSIVTFDDSRVEKIVFKTGTVDGTVRVVELDEPFDATGEPEGEVLVPIDPAVPSDASDTSATVRIDVPTAEIASVGADPETVVLTRYADGEWTALETRVVARTDSTVQFEAETPGFSQFALTAVSRPDATFDTSGRTLAVNESLVVDAARSTYEDGGIEEYEWRVAGENYTGRSTEIPFEASGEYTLELTVTTEHGTRDTETRTITVEATGTSGQQVDDQSVGETNGDGQSDSKDTEQGDGDQTAVDADGGGSSGFDDPVRRFLLYLSLPLLALYVGFKLLARHRGY